MADEEKDVLTEETLINEILSELKIELEVESEQDILLLQSKIKGAVREVKQKRNYAVFASAAALTITAKASAFRDAPPTSAPSISG